MAKKIKFPLKMTDGAEARTLDELKEHFDAESVVGYFHDGRLLRWLNDRYYDREAEQVSQLTKDDSELHKKLCAIFGVESAEDVDVEEIARRQERLNKLKQFTADREIWARVDQVAFDQEDLSDLLDEDATLIYLCANRFTIPLRVTDKNYVGIGKAVAVIRSDKVVDFDALNIKFTGIRFDDGYQKVLDAREFAERKKIADEKAALPKKLFDEGNAAYDAKDFKTALEKYKASAELGYAKALTSVGMLYFNGEGVQKDDDEAWRWFERGIAENDGNAFAGMGVLLLGKDDRKAFEMFTRADELGNTDANFFLGNMYRDGVVTEKNLAEAFGRFKRGHSDGDAHCTNMIGVMFSRGEHVDKNPAKAFEFFKKAAESGNVPAMKNLAECYYDGDGVTKDYGEAFRWRKAAAERGDPESMNRLGVMYENGRGVAKNSAEAFRWYKAAVEAGELWGMYNLSHMYRRGKGTAKNTAEGIRLLEKAAELGLTDAATKLGYLYRDGDGVTRDYYKAAIYFKRAADAGDGEGMNGLALLYDGGQGVKEDKRLAYQWFLKSAEAGSLIGMANVGYCYLIGEGTAKNMVNAGKWLYKSAEGGNYFGMVRYGDFLFESERYAEALNWYEKAYNYSSGYDAGRAAYKIGKLYEKTAEVKKSGGIIGKVAKIMFPTVFQMKAVLDVTNSAAKDDEREAERWLNRAKELGYKPKDGCFITTAVCGSFGKSDDCAELTAFRNFRDGWLTAQPDGKSLIAEYYLIAPKIVAKINTLPDAAQIYENIWRKYLAPCLSFIHGGENSACKKLYIEMVTALKKKFLEG